MKNEKFNKSNIPFLMAVSIFGLILVLSFLVSIFQNDIFIVLLMLSTILFILLLCLVCPIGLIFQLLNKSKTKFDKILIVLNGMVTLFVIFLLISFPNVLIGEKQVRKQVENEYAILNKEYQPILDYLAKYKKENGVYPDKIEEKIIPDSRTFDRYKYHTNLEGNGYWLQVYPKKGPIEYYYNDENDYGYNYYKGNGYIDGAFDNDNFYEINKNWHAIKLDYFTIHSFLFNGGQIERETDEWIKNNIEKFNQRK